MKNTFIILLISIFGIVKAYSADIFLDNKKIYLNTTFIGNIEYISPQDLSPDFLSIQDYTEHKLLLSSSEIKFSAGSFFIVFESEKEMLVHQMPAPPLKYKGKIYLPVMGFFSAMNAFGIIKAEISEDKINIYTNNFKEKKKSETNKISEQRKTVNEKQNKTPKVTKDETINSKITPLEVKKEDDNNAIAGEEIKPTQIHKTFYSLTGEIMEYYNYKKEIKDTMYFDRKDYPPDIYLLPQNLKRKNK